MTVQTDIERIREAKAAYQALIREIGTKSIRELGDTVMATTGAEGLRWRQYTPYFNDGDPCTFSVHEADIMIDGDWLGEYDLYDWDQEARKTSQWVRVFKPGMQEAYEALTGFNSTICNLDEVMLEAFGDHAMVTYDGTEFTVEGVDHD